METKDDDAIQMIEDSIEGIKGLDGYKEDEGVAAIPETVRQDGPVGPKGVMEELIGSNDVFVPIPMPIDPRPAQTDKGQRLDHMNDLMRDMRVEMEKREMGEARRVSDVVEQAGGTDGSTKRNYRDYLLQQ